VCLPAIRFQLPRQSVGPDCGSHGSEPADLRRGRVPASVLTVARALHASREAEEVPGCAEQQSSQRIRPIPLSGELACKVCA
jgi:hypothetical protein